jgi:8-oxo-dGTP pyrophosphatase MutT (NUDIX family)
MIELPAGKLESGEDPAEAALREFREETGYTAGSIKHISSFYCELPAFFPTQIGSSEKVI